jgi:hypothetical protein
MPRTIFLLTQQKASSKILSLTCKNQTIKSTHVPKNKKKPLNFSTSNNVSMKTFNPKFPIENKSKNEVDSKTQNFPTSNQNTKKPSQSCKITNFMQMNIFTKKWKKKWVPGKKRKNNIKHSQTIKFSTTGKSSFKRKKDSWNKRKKPSWPNNFKMSIVNQLNSAIPLQRMFFLMVGTPWFKSLHPKWRPKIT